VVGDDRDAGGLVRRLHGLGERRAVVGVDTVQAVDVRVVGQDRLGVRGRSGGLQVVVDLLDYLDVRAGDRLLEAGDPLRRVGGGQRADEDRHLAGAVQQLLHRQAGLVARLGVRRAQVQARGGRA